VSIHALVIQHANCIVSALYCVISGLCSSTMFFHNIL
jgi:hypothetical protein